MARIANADAFAARVGPTIMGLKAEGRSLRAIAAVLTEMGVQTAEGGRWDANAVRRVANRLA